MGRRRAAWRLGSTRLALSSGLGGVACPEFGKDLIGRDVRTAVQPGPDRFPQSFESRSASRTTSTGRGNTRRLPRLGAGSRPSRRPAAPSACLTLAASSLHGSGAPELQHPEPVLPAEPGLRPTRFNALVRSHWGIENSLHWVLDVTMDEDRARNRKDHGPENLALLRRLALNVAKLEPSSRLLKCAWLLGLRGWCGVILLVLRLAAVVWPGLFGSWGRSGRTPAVTPGL